MPFTHLPLLMMTSRNLEVVDAERLEKCFVCPVRDISEMGECRVVMCVRGRHSRAEVSESFTAKSAETGKHP